MPRPDPGWDAFARELGVNLHRLRLERGLTQEEVAYTAGMSRYTYQKFEKGESAPGTPANPNLRNVMALAQLLGVTLDELVPPSWPDLRGGR
ncbi:MAG: helix-turn-helix transcriptional regulator [Microbacteriaceae bacterium]|nr:helix-turn-helix transcriptional regulator [Microbacteriaceae bacterium]